MTDRLYDWIPFYEEFADKLLEFKDKREELYSIVKKASKTETHMSFLHFEKDDWWEPRHYQIDPLSVMGIMNRQIKDTHRIELATLFASLFHIHTPIPTQFNGIPVLNNQQSTYGGIDEIWELFIEALQCARTNTFSREFEKAFEKAVASKGNGLAYISMGLFWSRPNLFMPLDKNSRQYIMNHYGISISNNSTDRDYVEYLRKVKEALATQSPVLTFPEVSFMAWEEANKNKSEKTSRVVSEENQGKFHDSSYPSSETNATSYHNAFSQNIILYGPPGTGKTYSSIQYAVAIIEEKDLNMIQSESYQDVFSRYQKYKEKGLIAFTTFHQSFSYEEFIEGIRPVVNSEESSETGDQIEYEVHDGVFKAFCDKAGTPVSEGSNTDLGIGKNPKVWKVSLGGTGDNPTRSECFKNNHIRIGWDVYGETITDETDYSKEGGRVVLNSFYNKMQIGDIVMTCYSSKTIDGIGVVTGEPEWNDHFPQYKRFRNVRWLATGLNEDIVDLNAGKTMSLSTVYRLSVSASDALQLLRKVQPSLFASSMKIPYRVFIIDEINRGNISKIFGELITLIEPSKRIDATEPLRAILPYSGQNFGVPHNVYIIGTMNTADRSIALIDTALRRRFSFIEMVPNDSVLSNLTVESLSIDKMLHVLNKRITVLLDREHTIGHSYFLPLKENPTLEVLSTIFESKIIPLLQEYFYDDYEKIALVLGDNQKDREELQFIVQKTDVYELFGNGNTSFSSYFEINKDAFKEIEAYEKMQ